MAPGLSGMDMAVACVSRLPTQLHLLLEFSITYADGRSNFFLHVTFKKNLNLVSLSQSQLLVSSGLCAHS